MPLYIGTYVGMYLIKSYSDSVKYNRVFVL